MKYLSNIIFLIILKKQIISLCDDGKLDENDIQLLDKLKYEIADTYSKGKLNELHYNVLKQKISGYKENVDG